MRAFGGVLLGALACSTGGGAGEGPPCPAGMPVAATACAVPRIECEYGADPRPQCRFFAVCLGATSGDPSALTWRTQTNTCGALPAVACPATAAAAAGQACSPKDAWCTYADAGRCHCTDCRRSATSTFCSGMPVWTCEGSETHAGCPKLLPRLGSGCAGGVTCSYGCDWGTVTCTNGIWQRGAEVCPNAASKSMR